MTAALPGADSSLPASKEKNISNLAPRWVILSMNNERMLIGKDIRRFAETGSTNTDLLDMAETCESGTVLTADRQTAGRGRLGRTWTSSGGGLYLSVLFRDIRDLGKFIPFTVLSALAVGRVLSSYLPGGIAVKWPNDVYVNRRKICGILPESRVQGETINAVIGIGVNLNNVVASLPDLRHPAVSLKELTGSDIDRDEFLDRVLDELDLLYAVFAANGLPPFISELDDLLYARGTVTELRSGSGSQTVIPLGFAPDGALRCYKNGSEVMLRLGEY